MTKPTLTTTAVPSKLMPLIALCLGYFMVIIDVTIVNVALPSIAKSLHGGISELQWVAAGYTLPFACLLLSAGNLADRFGAKRAFLYGLGMFVVTSFGCGIASSSWLLIVFRVLQGVGAALIVPTSLSLINASYKNANERAKAIGIWACIGGVAGASGPILGAMLTAWFSWRAVFFVNVPIGVAAILLTNKYVFAVNPTNKEGGFDLLGQIVGIISIAALAFCLITAGKLPWLSVPVMGALCVFVVAFVMFLLIEHHSRAPMLSLKLFHSPTFSVAIAAGLIINIGFYGNLFLLPLYFQQIRGYSILMTGFAILPQVVLNALASYLGGKMTSVTGSRTPMLIGFAIGAVGFLTMLIAGAQTPNYAVLILPLAAIGFGAAFIVPPVTVAAIHAVPENRAGIASGAVNAGRQLGSLLGIALFGMIVNTAANFIVGMRISLIMAAVLYLLANVIILKFIPKELS